MFKTKIFYWKYLIEKTYSWKKKFGKISIMFNLICIVFKIKFKKINIHILIKNYLEIFKQANNSYCTKPLFLTFYCLDIARKFS